jgi:hypothetical protein
VLAGMPLSWQMGALLQQSWQQVTLVIQPSKKVTATFVSYQHGSAASLRCCCENPFFQGGPFDVGRSNSCCQCCSAFGKTRVQTRVHVM